jgi:hypothetical protein
MDQLPRRPIAQSKNPVSVLSVKQPVAPPIYRPQVQPLIAQRKTAQGTLQKRPPVALPMRPASATIQRASYTAEALDRAVDAGARLGAREDQWIDLDTVSRKKLGWFGSTILKDLGIDEKPAPGSKCQNCGKVSSSFELDHMSPWRHYAAPFMTGEFIKKSGGKILVRADALKVLYNDPENLWWICRGCNNPKSDKIPESKEHAAGDFSHGVYGRSAAKPSAIMKEIGKS